MKCEDCGEREAQIHLTQIVDNSVSTVHLCDQCAVAKGVQTGFGTSSPLNDFVASIGQSIAPLVPAGEDAECAGCHSTLGKFRESGKLGCPQCYDTFAAHLKDLLRRLHGSSQHAGKYYFGLDSDADIPRRAAELRKQLERAIASENFELAAELRDQLQVLE